EWLRISGGAKSPDAAARRGTGAAGTAAGCRTRGRDAANPGEVRRPACRAVRKSGRRISGRAQEKGAPHRRPSVGPPRAGASLDRSISIRGARTHNLADISLEIPREKLTVVTGVSGSGKSSLVFDTVYAEGQRRYVQSLSTYARLFLERMERPDVDSISEIPPALALRQKNTIKNARSTVGTVTEISDYLRLLFATVGRTVCPKCGGEVSRDSVESAGAQILDAPGLYVILAPFEAGSRSLPDAAGYLIQNGYHCLYANDAITETAEFAARAIATEAQNGAGPKTDRTMMVVVDRISVTGEGEIERVREALEKAFYLGAGRARAVRVERDNGNTHSVGAIDFDRRFNCSRC